MSAIKKTAVINDLSGMGRCSLTAALPVLSVLGAECCPLPTAVLSNQTGYDSFFCCDFTEHLEPYIKEWQKRGAQFDGILTGYLGSARQVQIIERFIKKFKTDGTVYLCDPVMADDGKFYGTYDEEMCRGIRTLCRSADIITPNLTELCFLTGASYGAVLSRLRETGDTAHIAALGKSLLNERLRHVIVTGVCTENQIHNLVIEETGCSVYSAKRFGGSYSGTGDLFASAVLGSLLKGKSVSSAVETAVRFLEFSIADAYASGNDRNEGVNFQKYLEMLLK